MTASTLNQATYKNVADNTVNNAVLDAAAILAWRQDVKAVVDQHAVEIDGKVKTSGDTVRGKFIVSHTIADLLAVQRSAANNANIQYTTTAGIIYAGNSDGTTFAISTNLDLNGSANFKVDATNGALTINGARIFAGSGSPEGATTAPVGSIYLRKDGGAGTTFYVKQSGTGNAGWVAK